jgi:hypothetical protein
MMYVVPVFVAAGFLVAVAAFCWLTRPGPESRAERLADPAPLPGEVPFPVDTGPLLIVSELTSAGEAIGRDVRRAAAEAEWLIKQGERRIEPRWRR